MEEKRYFKCIKSNSGNLHGVDNFFTKGKEYELIDEDTLCPKKEENLYLVSDEGEHIWAYSKDFKEITGKGDITLKNKNQ